MKKILLGLLALLLCIGMTSCKAIVDKKETKEAGVGTEIDMSFADIVAQAKAEGANWSIDEWKDCIRNLGKVMNAWSKENEMWKEKIRNETNVHQSEELAIQADEELTKKYGDVEKLLDEFNEIVEMCENAVKVCEDKTFQEEILNEYPYIPHDSPESIESGF